MLKIPCTLGFLAQMRKLRLSEVKWQAQHSPFLSKPESGQAGVWTQPKLLDLPDCRASSTGTARMEWGWNN